MSHWDIWILIKVDKQAHKRCSAVILTALYTFMINGKKILIKKVQSKIFSFINRIVILLKRATYLLAVINYPTA